MGVNRPTNGSEDGVHELVELCWVHEPVALEDAHSQLRNHRQMCLEHGAYCLAEVVIVLDRFDFLHFPERVEGVVIQVIDLVEVWVRDDDVGQLLHVPDPVGDSRRQLSPDIVGRADQPRLGQGAAKHHELA
jgi:hypothetical protein